MSKTKYLALEFSSRRWMKIAIAAKKVGKEVGDLDLMRIAKEIEEERTALITGDKWNNS